MTGKITHKEFEEEVNEIARLIAASDGIHDFVGGEIRALFSKDKEFRKLVKKQLPEEPESKIPELVRANKYLMERRTNIKPLLSKAVSEQASEQVISEKKEETPVSMHSRKVLEALDTRKTYLNNAETRISKLLEKSGRDFEDEKEKTLQIEKIKTEISNGLEKEHTKKASLRYLSNNFSQPKNTDKILEAMKKSMNCNMNHGSLEKLKEHFPRVERLELSSHNKKTRKTRR